MLVAFYNRFCGIWLLCRFSELPEYLGSPWKAKSELPKKLGLAVKATSELPKKLTVPGRGGGRGLQRVYSGFGGPGHGRRIGAVRARSRRSSVR